MLGLGLGVGRTARRGLAQSPAVQQIVSAIGVSGWQAMTFANVPVVPQELGLRRMGFTAQAAACMVNDTVALTTRVRQTYPTQASFVANAAALSDYVYATDTMLGAANQSAELSPKPAAAWAMPSRLLVGGQLHWELVAFHRDAREGKPVACARVRAHDGGNVTPWQVVSTPTISALCEDAQPLEVLQGDLDISSLADGLIWLEAEIYPWIGDGRAVLSTVGVSNLREFGPRYFTKNIARAAAPPLVYVASTGNDATGVCATSSATASAAPFKTIQGAITGAIAASAVSGGKVDGLRVRVVDTVSWGTFNNAINRNQHSAAVVIERAPGVLRANAVVVQSAEASLKFGYGGTLDSRLGQAAIIFTDVSLQRTAAGQITPGGAAPALDVQLWNVAFDNGSIAGAWVVGANSTLQIFGAIWLNYNSNFTYTTSFMQPLYRGLIANLNGGSIERNVVLGCRLTNGTMGGSGNPTKGPIVYGNMLLAPPAGNFALDINSGASAGSITGVVVVQNLFERVDAGVAGSLRISGDAQNGNLLGAIVAHNVFTGYGITGRANMYYDESAGTTRRDHRLIRDCGNIYAQFNTKGDIFVGTSQANPAEAPYRTGNFAVTHGVGCAGNFSMFATQAPASQAQTYAGVGCSMGSSSTVRQNPLFTDYRGTGGSGGTAAVGAGGGNYSLQMASPARGLLTRRMLSYDLGGVARPLGAQAAGAYG